MKNNATYTLNIWFGRIGLKRLLMRRIDEVQGTTFSRGKGLKQEKVNCLHFEKIVGVALRVGNIRHLRVFVVLSKPSWAEIVKGVNNEVRYAQTWVMNDVYMYCARLIHHTLMLVIYVQRASFDEFECYQLWSIERI